MEQQVPEHSQQDELQAVKAELEKVRAEYQEFIYIVSHDLNAPPRKMLAFATRLQGHAGDQLDEKSAHYLDRIVANAHTLQSQIDALLRVSRCRPSDDPSKIRPVNLVSVFAELAEALQPRLSELGAELSVDAGLPDLQGNTKQIQDLFRELLKNSLQFASAERPLRISVRDAGSDDQVCRIEVEDNGVGFDGRYADVIFQIFQQLGLSEGARLEPGVGAGLSIAKKAAETHGGGITAHGTPGEGARFVVKLSKVYPHAG